MSVFDFSRWRPPPSCIFWNFEFSTVGTIKRVELHQRAKFHQNRLNCDRDMAFFRFFKMATNAILDLWNCTFLTVGTLKRVELHHLAKFRRNRSNSGWEITIFWFLQDDGRPPSSICNACVETTHECIWWSLSLCKIWLGIFDPNIPNKAHPCASPRRFSRNAWKSVDGSDL